MLHDFRHALRLLRKSPGFTFVAVLTLGLGIGANTAIFSVINEVLLRELPYREPERLVAVFEQKRSLGANTNVISPANFIDWRERSTSFSELAAFNDRSYSLTGVGEPEQIAATGATANLFSMLGVQPLLGRLFTPADENPDQPLVVVLTYEFWQRRFGGDPAVVGRAVNLNETPATVIGVLPAGFAFQVKEASFNGRLPDAWVQVRFSAASRQRTGRFMGALGQLKPGVTLAQAQSELDAIAAQLAVEHPNFNSGWTINAVPLQRQLTGEVRPVLWMLFGAVALVLLITCANLANLLLARGAAREGEFAVRAALGASRARLVRQMLAENLLLAIGGGLAGLLVAQWGLDAFVSILPAGLLGASTISLSLPVLAITGITAIATGFLFGLLPSWIGSRVDLQLALKSGSSQSTRPRLLQQGFIIAQIALAVVVLVSAVLLGRSFDRLLSTDTGFDPRNLFTAQVTVPSARYSDPAAITRFYRTLVERVGALPGVTAASGMVFAPFSGPGAATGFQIEGRPEFSPDQVPVTDVRVVSADFFGTMRIPLREGRDFSRDEHEQARRVVIINESLARKHFPGRSAIGEKLAVQMFPEKRPCEVIGVVADIKHVGLNAEVREMVFFPHVELPLGFVTLLVRTAHDPSVISAGVRRELKALDANLPLAGETTMEQLIAGTVTRARFASLVFGLFAVLALLLSALGIYGVVSYAVQRQTRETGIRMALGANRARVLRDVLGYGGRLAGLGVLVGLAAALGATRLISSQLYSVSATDPLTFAGVAVGFLLVALVACLLPARRATQVDPLVALRSE